jgi:hypothetical protein
VVAAKQMPPPKTYSAIVLRGGHAAAAASTVTRMTAAQTVCFRSLMPRVSMALDCTIVKAK